jgi:chemotaxis signal transduction protein
VSLVREALRDTQWHSQASTQDAAAGRASQQLGLVAEDVISVCSAEDAEASLPSLEFGSAPFLGRILRIGGRTIQLLEVEKLLPGDVSSGLFPSISTVVPQ